MLQIIFNKYYIKDITGTRPVKWKICSYQQQNNIASAYNALHLPGMWLEIRLQLNKKFTNQESRNEAQEMRFIRRLDSPKQTQSEMKISEKKTSEMTTSEMKTTEINKTFRASMQR